METGPSGSSINRLHSTTFKLNDFLNEAGWQLPKSQSEFAVRKRVEQLGDRRIVNATQFRETNTETIVGCRVTILDTNRPIPHVMVAEWSPLSINEHEFGIDEVEAALDEVA